MQKGYIISGISLTNTQQEKVVAFEAYLSLG